jgi:hypothetical protein
MNRADTKKTGVRDLDAIINAEIAPAQKNAYSATNG